MYNGIIIVDKPEGITSHGVVSRIRRILSEKRVGHGGTLDPMATGVLPVFVGRATKASEYLLNARKAYTASFCVGFETDTEDITGKIVKTSPVRPRPDEVESALFSFLGEIEQVPPMYSAIKSDGKKLYELARQGIEVERKPRRVTVYDIGLMESDPEKGEYTFSVESSKGLYVRTLCRDVGRRLGSLAAMSALRRTKTGPFDISEAYTLEEIEAMHNAGDHDFVIPCDKVFGEYPAVWLKEDDVKKAMSGQLIPLKADGNDYKGETPPRFYRVYAVKDKQFVMLARPAVRAGVYGLIIEKNFSEAQ